MAATHIYPTSKTEKFIEKARNVHGHDKYDYSLVDYKMNKTKVTIICPVHGEFEQKPNDHLSGRGCSECSNERGSKRRKSNTKDFIEKAKEIHGHDKYDYSLVEYKYAIEKVTIICPDHGKFEQRPNNHLGGKGCPKCAYESRKGSLTKKFLEDNPEKAKENCIFYIIEMYNDEESFIKCGITQGTIQERFSGLKEYDYEIVDSLETTLENAINLEYYFDENFEKYRPRNRFYGHTECFELSELENTQNIFNHLFQIAS